MKKFAIIVAGGTGARMQSVVPKQFILLKEKPLLYYTLKAFLDAYDDMQIILVLPESHVSAGQEVIDAYFNYDRIQIAIGGRERFHSVQNGLALVDEESIVMVHDAVRCLITKTLIQRCYDAVLSHGSAIPVVQCRDSIRQVDEDENRAINRSTLRLVQTPQAFYSKIILPAFKIDYKEWFTDEAAVTEAFGLKLNLVEGEEENIKVTHPIDLIVAEVILNSRAS